MAAYDGPAWDEYIAQGAADGYQMASDDDEPFDYDNMELKAQLDEIEESFRTCDAQLEANVNRLGRIVDSWSHGRLTEEQEEHVLRAALPRLLAMVLRIRVTHAVLADRISRFLQHVLGVVAESLRNDESVIAAELASRILTDAHHFLFYDAPFAPRSPSGDLDSQSSGAESGDDSDGMAAMMDGGGAPGGAHHGHYGEDVVSDRLGDDRSPRYLQNVEAFHNNGGFDACVERLGRPPMSLSAMRCCLRPLLKCAPVLRRSVLGRWAQRAAALALAAVAGLPNESLKGEDRRTISEVVRLLESLLHAARLPDAASLLNRFQLTLAHKCLRTPYLEKRLIGLSAPPPAAAAAAPAPAPRPRRAPPPDPRARPPPRRRHQGDDQPDDPTPRVRRGVDRRRGARAARRPRRLGVAPPSRRRDGRRLVVARDARRVAAAREDGRAHLRRGAARAGGEPLRRTPRLSRDAGRARR